MREGNDIVDSLSKEGLQLQDGTSKVWTTQNGKTSEKRDTLDLKKEAKYAGKVWKRSCSDNNDVWNCFEDDRISINLEHKRPEISGLVWSSKNDAFGN